MIAPEGDRHRLRRCFDHLGGCHRVAPPDEDRHVGGAKVDGGRKFSLHGYATRVTAGPSEAACRNESISLVRVLTTARKLLAPLVAVRNSGSWLRPWLACHCTSSAP